MQKFTKYQKTKNKLIDENIKFKNNNINILEYMDDDIIISNDKIAILPFLKDDGYILLKYEYIPTYQYKYKNTQNLKNIFNFLTIIKSDIKKDENSLKAIRRVLVEDCGLILKENYPINVDNILFKDEKNTSQYHISLLELNYNDFKQGPLKKDDEKNKIIKINLNEIEDIKSYDLITDYMFLKLKYEYKI